MTAYFPKGDKSVRADDQEAAENDVDGPSHLRGGAQKEFKKEGITHQKRSLHLEQLSMSVEAPASQRAAGRKEKEPKEAKTEVRRGRER
jgi:hypothetical protein